MIKRQTAFMVGNEVFATLEQAQKAELRPLFATEPEETWTEDGLLDAILKNKDKIIDVLTTTETSIPSARKINGGTKKRKPKPLPIIDASETAA